MRRAILYIFFVVVLLLLAISVLSGDRSQGQNVPLLVMNRTQAFLVLKAERGPNEFSITLKNNSRKTITAFSISPGKGYTILEEFVFAEISDIGVAPDATFAKSYPTLLSSQTESIEIKALVFDDGSSEGDARAVREIEDSRLGEQIQIRRAVRELQSFLETGSADVSELKRNLSKTLNSSDDETLNILTELKPARAATNRALSGDLRTGLSNGRQSVLRRLADAETNGSNTGFRELKETYERILERCPN